MLELANGNSIMIQYADQVFVTSCYSTAFKYPLIDGELFDGPAGPAIRVPLDGTTYDLTTGKVIEWCPKDNPIRMVLGSLKGGTPPEALPVYPVQVDGDGNVYTKFV